MNAPTRKVKALAHCGKPSQFFPMFPVSRANQIYAGLTGPDYAVGRTHFILDCVWSTNGTKVEQRGNFLTFVWNKKLRPVYVPIIIGDHEALACVEHEQNGTGNVEHGTGIKGKETYCSLPPSHFCSRWVEHYEERQHK